MIVLSCAVILSEEQKEILHEEFKKRTGEDCLILDGGIFSISELKCKKGGAVSLPKKLPRWFNRNKDNVPPFSFSDIRGLAKCLGAKSDIPPTAPESQSN